MFGKTAGLAPFAPSSMTPAANCSMLSIGPTPVPRMAPMRLRLSSVTSIPASSSASFELMIEKRPRRSTRLRSFGER